MTGKNGVKHDEQSLGTIPKIYLKLLFFGSELQQMLDRGRKYHHETAGIDASYKKGKR